MKYIFRYALLTNFAQQQKLTQQQLTEALKVAKFNLQGKNLIDLIQKNNECIRALLKMNDRRDIQGVIREQLEGENVQEAQFAQLATVWQMQKHLIFKKLVSQNSKSTKAMTSLNWAVRNNISGKSGGLNNSPTIVLHIKDGSEQIELTINKYQYHKISEKVKKADQFLDELFKSGS